MKKLQCAVDDVNQVWYADDASAAGKISRLRQWWNLFSSQCPGYFANATKTWLVTKEKFLTAARATFADTGIEITSEGWPCLGAAIGTAEFVQSHVEGTVAEWTKELESLATIALTQPHAAHAALTHGLSSK